jgi:hypothetical protein
MTKAGGGGGQQCNNQLIKRAAKSKQWLVTRPPEGSGCQLVAKSDWWQELRCNKEPRNNPPI